MIAGRAAHLRRFPTRTAARRVGAALLGLALVAPMLSACDGGRVADSPSPAHAARIALPPAAGVFDYQLGGTGDVLSTDNGDLAPTVVARDSTARPLAGAYNICYVNGFQTQPGDADFWLHRPELLVHGTDGVPLIDPDWPDEYILDPSTPTQREAILERIGAIIDGCAEDGFDAVEIDNLDTWTRFDQIDKAGAFALARSYVDRAHKAGLAIAQKNAAEATADAHQVLGFDFAVAEDCAAWDECGAYTKVYGEHVLQIEYPEALAAAGITFDDVCALEERGSLTILRDVNLVAPGDAGHIYESCSAD